MPRFFCSHPLQVGLSLDLPADTSRHIQVLRLQPGASITLFDGRGGEYTACILQMGRHTVAARIDSHQLIERESTVYSHVVIGMPANERMDWLVEKATELGVRAIQPIVTQNASLPAGNRAWSKSATRPPVITPRKPPRAPGAPISRPSGMPVRPLKRRMAVRRILSVPPTAVNTPPAQSRWLRVTAISGSTGPSAD